MAVTQKTRYPGSEYTAAIPIVEIVSRVKVKDTSAKLFLSLWSLLQLLHVPVWSIMVRTVDFLIMVLNILSKINMIS